MKDKKKENLKNLFIADLNLLNNDPGYVGEILNAYDGSTLEETQEEGKEIINKIIFNAMMEVKKNQMDEKLSKASLFLSKIKKSTENQLSSIQNIFNEKSPAFQVNFRELKNVNENDALNILKDIELLDILDNYDL